MSAGTKHPAQSQKRPQYSIKLTQSHRLDLLARPSGLRLNSYASHEAVTAVMMARNAIRLMVRIFLSGIKLPVPCLRIVGTYSFLRLS